MYVNVTCSSENSLSSSRLSRFSSLLTTICAFFSNSLLEKRLRERENAVARSYEAYVGKHQSFFVKIIKHTHTHCYR